MERVRVTLPADVYAALTWMAAARGVAFAGLLREALTLVKYVADEERAGGRVFVEASDGTRRRVSLSE